MLHTTVKLLKELTDAAAPLAHAESLEDFKEQGKHVCKTCSSVSPQQLDLVRSELKKNEDAQDASGMWQLLADKGVSMPDVAQ